MKTKGLTQCSCLLQNISTLIRVSVLIPVCCFLQKIRTSNAEDSVKCSRQTKCNVPVAIYNRHEFTFGTAVSLETIYFNTVQLIYLVLLLTHVFHNAKNLAPSNLLFFSFYINHNQTFSGNLGLVYIK